MCSENSSSYSKLSDELLWKQYELNTLNLKSNFEIALKIISSFFLFSGAITTFYLTHPEIANISVIMIFVVVTGLLTCQYLLNTFKVMARVEAENIVIKEKMGFLNDSVYYNQASFLWSVVIIILLSVFTIDKIVFMERYFWLTFVLALLIFVQVFILEGMLAPQQNG